MGVLVGLGALELAWSTRSAQSGDLIGFPRLVLDLITISTNLHSDLTLLDSTVLNCTLPHCTTTISFPAILKLGTGSAY